MKKIIFLLGVIILFSSCVVKNMGNIDPKDYSKYIRTTDSNGYEYSPLSYNVVKGINPCAEYSWMQATITNYFVNYYFDDKTKLLQAYFKDADVIMAFHGYYYIGTKLKKGE